MGARLLEVNNTQRFCHYERKTEVFIQVPVSVSEKNLLILTILKI
jgi:hypothetical protein